MPAIFGYLFIFISRVIDVSLSTMKTLMVVQGRRKNAAIIGFVEIIIYVSVLGTVMSNLDNIFNLLAYAFGYAAGNFVGITIEEKVALGNSTAQIIIKEDAQEELATALRDKGFGVTIIEGKGKDSNRQVLLVVLERKAIKKLQDIVHEVDPNAFVTVNSITPIYGGYFSLKK
ncbi:MAG: DUF2179 domain-containing protein [Tissierellia bacterium]|nr:DUF2179 domain-containing protein [Tissierellia bacterium]